ncbi:MAG: class II aldolase/adducin family protein [Clostridiales Family XIII bacterium]|jgi:L-fuculose-phosphate aldolase|nr:class II aldolase/adducin family protein [Clostridiales Family XIII bacterium]
MTLVLDKRISRHYLELVNWATHQLAERDLTPSGTSGDVSLRDPQTGLIYVTGGHIDQPFPKNHFHEFSPQDMAVFEPDGTRITPWSHTTIELPMHLAIYRARPDVHAIVHGHPKWSSVFAIVRRDIPLVLAEQWGNLKGEVKVAKYAPAGEMEMGDFVAEALGDRNAVIMANHGSVTVGPTFGVAFRHAHFLEQIAQKAIFAQLLGDAVTLDPESINAKAFMKGTSGSPE